MIRIRTTVILAVVYLTLGTATTLHAQERTRTGTWENTMTAKGQTSTRSHCLTPAEAALTNGSPATIRAETEKALSNSGCTLKNFKLEGNTLTHTMVCESRTVLTETKFHGGDSIETTMTSTGDGVTQVTQFKGRWTGPCKAGEQ